ncbi:MAG: hypothetical protein LBT23_03185 [Synergistaceae bacterium]|nr:hypothetical protein [Synergistaceae bacterium]
MLSFIALVILAVIYFKYFSRVFYKHGLSQREEEPEIKEIARSREIGEFKEPQIFKEVKDAHKVSIAIQEAIMTAGLAATKEKTEIMDIMYVEEKFEEKEKEQEKEQEQEQEKEEIKYKATSEEAPNGPISVLRLEKAIEFRRPEANKKEKGEFVLLMDDIVDMDVGG